MKKILLLVLLLLSLYQIKAQHNIFVKAGTNMSNIIHKPESGREMSYKLGFQLGVGDRYEITNHFNMAAELLFVNKGEASPHHDKVHLNYLSIPVVLGFNVGNFNFELGPQVGYLLFSNTDPVFSRFDASLLAGISYAATDRLNLNIRYVEGLSSIDSTYITDDGVTGTMIEMYNRSFQLSLSYRLNK